MMFVLKFQKEGPMLFNLYTCDITYALSDDAFNLQYAEDKQILLSVNKSTSLNSIEYKINNILSAKETWSNQNGLSLNLSKTKILPIYNKNSKFCCMNSLSNGFSNYTFVKEAENLGFIYSYNMSWKNHFITLLKSTKIFYSIYDLFLISKYTYVTNYFVIFYDQKCII